MFRDKVIDTGNRGVASLGEVSVADYVSMKAGGFWTNAGMPATATSGTLNKHAKAIFYRRGRPPLRTACLPTWGTVTVDDIYSDAGSRMRHYTISVLVKVLLVQPVAYQYGQVNVTT